jgi:dTDP-4-dehydrorhamnose 3,5-epimerase
MFAATSLDLGDAFQFSVMRFGDDRGGFVKYMSEGVREQLPNFQIREVFITSSHRGVVRGLHFQDPPRPQAKLVAVISGSVYEVVVDLRVGSPTYGNFAEFEMSAPKSSTSQVCGLFVPIGFAHGYAVLEDDTQVLYCADEDFDPVLDSGISWQSVRAAWPFEDPILSAKDKDLPQLEDYCSQFNYSEQA